MKFYLSKAFGYGKIVRLKKEKVKGQSVVKRVCA